jgi:hypothetical protein
LKIDNFFSELKRRNVYKVAVAYVVAAWLLTQAASILFPTFNAPAWLMQVVVIILVLGFPAALVFAWAFEITPEGIVRESNVEGLPWKVEPASTSTTKLRGSSSTALGVTNIVEGSVRRNPGARWPNYLAGYLDLKEGKNESARAHFDATDEAFRQTGTAMLEYTLGHAAESEQALNELKTKYTAGSAFQIAAVYAWRGEKDHAFEWLERAYEQRDAGMPRLRYDPTFASLHDDPRFSALVKKMEFSE